MNGDGTQPSPADEGPYPCVNASIMSVKRYRHVHPTLNAFLHYKLSCCRHGELPKEGLATGTRSPRLLSAWKTVCCHDCEWCFGAPACVMLPVLKPFNEGPKS
jgi:hypothetical protein